MEWEVERGIGRSLGQFPIKSGAITNTISGQQRFCPPKSQKPPSREVQPPPVIYFTSAPPSLVSNIFPSAHSNFQLTIFGKLTWFATSKKSLALPLYNCPSKVLLDCPLDRPSPHWTSPVPLPFPYRSFAIDSRPSWQTSLDPNCFLHIHLKLENPEPDIVFWIQCQRQKSKILTFLILLTMHLRR